MYAAWEGFVYRTRADNDSGTSKFVADLFDAIENKTYLPEALRPPPRPAPYVPTLPLEAIQNGSRKRSYYEAIDQGGQSVPDSSSQERAIKQPRFNTFGSQIGGPAGVSDIGSPSTSRAYYNGRPPAPGVAQYDPSNPFAAFMQMQHMPQMTMGMPVAMDVQRPRRRKICRDYASKGICTRPNCKFEHNPQLDLNDAVGRGHPVLSQSSPDLSSLRGGTSDEYDPRQSSMVFSQVNGGSSDLRPPLVADNGVKPRIPRKARNGGKPKQKVPKGRAAFSAKGPSTDRSNTLIVVENIPEENYSEEQVRDFFSQFGEIHNVYMQEYRRIAVVTYDTWDSANKAYISPKVVFDNRFVKVYWYKDLSKDSPPPPYRSTNGKHGPSQSPGPIDLDRPETEPEIDMDELIRKTEEAQRLHVERVARQEDIDRQRQELQTRQKELITDWQAEKQRLAVKLAAKDGNRSPSPDILLGNKRAQPSSHTEALRAQLAALEAEAAMLGLDPDADPDDSPAWGAPRGRGSGRGGFRARGYRGLGGWRGGGHRGGGYRGGGWAGTADFAAYSLDNRPKIVRVTGLDFTAAGRGEMLREYLLVSTTPNLNDV
jgi:RNA-binding protein 26